MKRLAIALSILMALLPTAALANSGPVTEPGYPSVSAMSVDENCPIEVSHEDLTFDLSNAVGRSGRLEGVITAVYDMHNPTGQIQRVHMAFPTVSKPGLYNTLVTVDKCTAEYDIQYGNTIPDDSSNNFETHSEMFSLESILEQLGKEKDVTPKYGNTGQLYTVTNTTDEDIKGTLSFSYNSTKTQYIPNVVRSFHGMESEFEGDMVHVKLTFSLWAGASDGLLMLGDAPQDIVLDDAVSEKCMLSNETTDVEDYLRGFADDSVEYTDHEWDNYLYPAMVNEINNTDPGHPGGAGEQLGMVFYNSMMAVITFDVEFQPNQSRSIMVETDAISYMSESGGKQTFHYLTNPAKHWASFGDLDVKVIPPEGYADLTDSNYDWLLDESTGTFTAHNDSLPDGDLHFTLVSNYAPSQGYSMYIVTGGMFLFVLMVIILARRNRRKA